MPSRYLAVLQTIKALNLDMDIEGCLLSCQLIADYYHPMCYWHAMYLLMALNLATLSASDQNFSMTLCSARLNIVATMQEE